MFLPATTNDPEATDPRPGSTLVDPSRARTSRRRRRGAS